MTKLNLRSNAANILRLAAKAVEEVQVPEIKLPAKDQIASKAREYRIRAAAMVMPKGVAFVIEEPCTKG
jgi:hypothetical protein